MFRFFKYLKNVIAFNQLPRKTRTVVFYSEGKNYWVHLQGLVNELLNTHKVPVCYVSSNDNDPGLAMQHPNFHSFLIDEGWIRNWWFENLEADMLVLSMPDIHQYQVKRSKHPVHYVYVQHSLVSKHMVYREGAFDHYDSIFCAAPHHFKEIRAIESLYNLKPKNLYEHGYARLDSILKNAQQNRNNESAHSAKPHVLIAPSWGEVNVVEDYGQQIIETLLNHNYKVTLRPHPQTIKFSKNTIDALVSQFSTNPDFSFEGNVDGEASLHMSDVMISDWSGAALDYAFGLGKPVLFLDVPRKVNNPEYEKLGIEPYEVMIREKIGRVISVDQVDEIHHSIEACLEKHKTAPYEHDIFNLGKSDEVGARLLIDISAKLEHEEG